MRVWRDGERFGEMDGCSEGNEMGYVDRINEEEAEEEEEESETMMMVER